MKRFMKSTCVFFLAAFMSAAACVAGYGSQNTDGTASEGTPDFVLTQEELGMKAYLAVTDDEDVVSARISDDGSVNFYAVKSGETTVAMKNSYGETVEARVSVGSGNQVDVDFTKYEMPEKWVNALDFGMHPTSGNNTAALQAAIDALPEGGVVYIPAGTYQTRGTVVLKEGVTIRMEGILADYHVPFDRELSTRIHSRKDFTILKGVSFWNLENSAMATEGADNLTVTGGMLDMVGTSGSFILICGENILLENMILKDCPNDHAIQVTGSRNVTIRNILFGGYALQDNTDAAEVIQIEPACPPSLGPSSEWRFGRYDSYPSENVLIESCYFGRSVGYGPPTYAIGQHGCFASYCASGITIKDCTFDNPMICAIRASGWDDVEIAGCSFRSDQEYEVSGGHYMIGLQVAPEGDVRYGSLWITRGYERGGCRNIDIHDNDFYIGPQSLSGGILQTLNEASIGYDFIGEGKYLATDCFTRSLYALVGYREVCHRFTEISFCGNDIEIENAVNSNYISLTGVLGLNLDDNQVAWDAQNQDESLLDGQRLAGVKLTGCMSSRERQKHLTILAAGANRSRPIALGSAEPSRSESAGGIEAYCTAETAEFAVSCQEGGKLAYALAEDGTLQIWPEPEDGYTFSGYYLDGQKVPAGKLEFDRGVSIEAAFRRGDYDE